MIDVAFAANAPGFGETQYCTSLNGRDPFTVLLEPQSIIYGQARFADSGMPAAAPASMRSRRAYRAHT